MAVRKERVFFHLRPGRYSQELIVSRMVKSLDVQVEPGDVVVEATISVPDGFFEEARPYVEVMIEPGSELQAPTIEILPNPDEDTRAGVIS